MNTPVALIIYNRPEHTRSVFDAIRRAKPQTLYLIADGADTAEDEVACSSARAVVEAVDWDCNVFKNYADSHLGLRKRLSSGLTWVFRESEEAIILEDDCVPHPTFFMFCHQLLDRYREDKRIVAICGDNFQDGQQRGPASYYFSKYPDIWGWASWRRAFQHFDVDMQAWTDYLAAGGLEAVCPDERERAYWTHLFNLQHIGDLNAWDYAWVFACFSRRGLTVTPNVNLVTNIGFDSKATHTRFSGSKLAFRPTQGIGVVTHPAVVTECVQADRYYFEHYFDAHTLLNDPDRKVALKQIVDRLKRRFSP